MRTLALTIGTVAALSLTACGTAATSATTPPATSTTSAMVHESGTFMGLNGKHVSGTVTVTGSQVTLAGFSSDQGPDLHIYLTKGTDETTVSQGDELAPVSYTASSQTFDLKGMSPSGFTYVVIHCDKAKAVFGAAPLS